MSEAASIHIRRSTPQDALLVQALYQRVARERGGLARRAEEVSADYVQHFLDRSHAHGIGLVAQQDGQLVAEIHAYSSGLQIFAHVLGDLTVAVDASVQGLGVGRRLFETLLGEVQVQLPHVRRVELLVRETNTRAIALYEKLGFQREGRLEGRVAGAHGFEADIPMAWHAPQRAPNTSAT